MSTQHRASSEAGIEWTPGVYHRRVVAVVEGNTVRAGMEDESHHMELTLTHDGRNVTDLNAVTRRIPWHACPEAAPKLRELIGAPLQRVHIRNGHDAKQHCTHLFDLARVAIARAAINTSVQYDISIPDRVDRKTQSSLLRDGKLLLTWHVNGSEVVGPDPFTGHSLRGAAIWPSPLDDDTLEAALVMRRVFLVSQARHPSAVATSKPGPAADQMLETLKRSNMVGVCYSFQPERMKDVGSNFSWRNMSGRRNDLLKDFPGVQPIAPTAP
jgi:hypothetical protein